MGKYKITHGQNIYDVALHIHGSIEGIVDLLLCNPMLCVDDGLKAGDELEFTDDFVINRDVVAYNTAHDLVPAAGERRVYPKDFTFPLLAEFHTKSTETSVSFSFSGKGTMEADWGDNCAPETITVSREEKNKTHYFDNGISGFRRIRIYGDFELNHLDISGLKAKHIYMVLPFPVLHTKLHNSDCPLEFFRLLAELRTLDLRGGRIADLSPLLDCKLLTSLDLTGCTLTDGVINRYLIALVRQHHGRQACRITLTTQPSGEYREPPRDSDLNYILTSGMEAVWLLTHEPAWNETGTWEFNINHTIYRYEQND